MDKTFNSFLKILNEALEADSNAISYLINNRIKCNKKLANHPTIQILYDGKNGSVGMLGIINGICEKTTGKRVAVVIDDNNGKIISFIEYKKK